MMEDNVLACVEDSIFYLDLHRADSRNTLDARLVSDLRLALSECEGTATVVVLEGAPEAFCLGADFGEVAAQERSQPADAEPFYDLLLQLAEGPYITIAHVRGQANAAGVGLAAACDMVIAAQTARFSLSELLFGLHPACVFPFLASRVGFQHAHYLALTTHPIEAPQACAWGLVDAYGPSSDDILRRHLQRARRFSKRAIVQYKSYARAMHCQAREAKSRAVAEHRRLFSNPESLAAIRRFVETGALPWEP